MDDPTIKVTVIPTGPAPTPTERREPLVLSFDLDAKHKTQPQAGDGFLHCGHLGTPGQRPKLSVFKAGPEKLIAFTRPDRTQGTATWLIVCEQCFWSIGGLPSELLKRTRGDGMFYGDGTALIRTNPEPPPPVVVRRVK